MKPAEPVPASPMTYGEPPKAIRNDNHFVEKQLPLCDICIQADRDKTIPPAGLMERKKAEEDKAKEVDDLQKQIAELTALVKQLAKQ